MPALSELTREVRNLLAEGDRASGSGDEFYKKAGEKLKHLKTNEYQRNRAGLNWGQFVQRHVGITKQYADYLIRVANGHANIDEARARKRVGEQQRRRRARTTQVERRRNGNGNHVVSTSQSSGHTTSAPSPGCDTDPYDADDVAEPGDDPAMVDARILINRLNEIAHQARVALGNARLGTTTADSELNNEIARSLADAMQATGELFDRMTRGGRYGQERHQEATH